MWIFTVFGFFSVTQSKKDPTVLQVRARVRKDLDNLRNRYLPTLTPTVHIQGRDYPYRGFCPHADVAAAMVMIVQDIGYSNFKSQVEKEQGIDREELYSKVWGVMYDAERKLKESARDRRRWSTTKTAKTVELDFGLFGSYRFGSEMWDLDYKGEPLSKRTGYDAMSDAEFFEALRDPVPRTPRIHEEPVDLPLDGAYPPMDPYEQEYRGWQDTWEQDEAQRSAQQFLRAQDDKIKKRKKRR